MSKTQIDRAGKFLSRNSNDIDDEYMDNEDIFEEYRKSHLHPLSDITRKIQIELNSYGNSYYIAQRLKRKPQILRKLRRLSVRLSQLQDIGGCRIIVDRNAQIDDLVAYLERGCLGENGVSVVKKTDYRQLGRDDTGYRAMHVLLFYDGRNFELQIRSKIQHYWAESIERTSVVYGFHLKEKEGDPIVINYFKHLSDIFFHFEAGNSVSGSAKIELDTLREESIRIIERDGKRALLESYVNDEVIKTLIEKERKSKHSGINNWIIVFDWSSGSFVTWDDVAIDPDVAVRKYIEYEKNYSPEQGFEVVMIGASDVATIQKTHSHYFGIKDYDGVLENLEQSIVGFSEKMNLDIGSRKILNVMARKKYWGGNGISKSTLKNHYCKDVYTFDSSFDNLIREKYLCQLPQTGAYALNLRKRADIEKYL